jgi:hypothetical protein
MARTRVGMLKPPIRAALAATEATHREGGRAITRHL